VKDTQFKNNQDAIQRKARRIFEEQISEAEAQGYLVVVKHLEYDIQHRYFYAEVDLVKDGVLYPMQMKKSSGELIEKYGYI